MDGRALSAGELATAAGIARPTASGHLSALSEGGLISGVTQGRHRYFRLAGFEVAGMIESLMALSSELRTAAETARPIRTGPADRKLRRARRCYDHLAGGTGVAIADALQRRGWLQLDSDGGLLSTEGREALAAAGLPLDLPAGAILCRPCLDWSERRPHLGGALGRALYDAMAARGWLRQSPTGRAVDVTPKGRHGLETALGLSLPADFSLSYTPAAVPVLPQRG